MSTNSVSFYTPGAAFTDDNGTVHSSPVFCVNRIMRAESTSTLFTMNENEVYDVHNSDRTVVNFNACFWTSQAAKDAGHSALELTIDGQRLFNCADFDPNSADDTQTQCFNELKEVIDARIAAS